MRPALPQHESVCQTGPSSQAGQHHLGVPKANAKLWGGLAQSLPCAAVLNRQGGAPPHYRAVLIDSTDVPSARALRDEFAALLSMLDQRMQQSIWQKDTQSRSLSAVTSNFVDP